MDEKQRYHRLGLFVIVTLAILFGILFILGGHSLFQPSLKFETYFDQSVAGLEIGAPIKFRGVPLGKVVEIEATSTLYEHDLPPEKRKGYIVVRGEVTGSRERIADWRKNTGAAVERGLRAQTQLAGITGQQYLALDFFDPKAYPPLEIGWKPENLYVPSAPSLTGQIIAGMQKFLASLNEAEIAQLGQNLNRLVVTVNTKLDQLDVAALSADATGLLKDARSTVQRIDAVIAKAPVDQAVTNIASASGRLDKLLAAPGLAQTVDNTAEVTARLRAATAEGGEVDRILKDLDSAIQRANAILGDNQYEIRGIVQDLRATADNLRALSETARRYPAGVLIGGPPEKVERHRKEAK
ncbi:MAG TPA: MlaD family protein [Burkholderiales bacterium]|nr:MlaD family protein [Burkholderiales bacterium]